MINDDLRLLFFWSCRDVVFLGRRFRKGRTLSTAAAAVVYRREAVASILQTSLMISRRLINSGSSQGFFSFSFLFFYINPSRGRECAPVDWYIELIVLMGFGGSNQEQSHAHSTMAATKTKTTTATSTECFIILYLTSSRFYCHQFLKRKIKKGKVSRSSACARRRKLLVRGNRNWAQLVGNGSQFITAISWLVSCVGKCGLLCASASFNNCGDFSPKSVSRVESVTTVWDEHDTFLSEAWKEKWTLVATATLLVMADQSVPVSSQINVTPTHPSSHPSFFFFFLSWRRTQADKWVWFLVVQERNYIQKKELRNKWILKTTTK